MTRLSAADCCTYHQLPPSYFTQVCRQARVSLKSKGLQDRSAKRVHRLHSTCEVSLAYMRTPSWLLKEKSSNPRQILACSWGVAGAAGLETGHQSCITTSRTQAAPGL